MAVRLSVLSAGSIYPHRRFLQLTSLGGSVNPMAMVQLEEFGKLKKNQ
jgi:hypothetical protein